MDANTRSRVRGRARDHCEYCGLPQSAIPLMTFHVEHIRAKQHDGSDDMSNLALSCHHCNLHKGPNLSGIDPETSEIVPLFHPRQDAWPEHFALQGAFIIGLTPIGRATVRVLAMNSSWQLETRADLG
jgi:5-methylcytosine-specific restriction endonuclease McrA